MFSWPGTKACFPQVATEQDPVMPIHFAAANDTNHASFVGSSHLRAANDNGEGLGEDTLLRAALRHFAEHGLSAAQRARENAERAFFAGNTPDYHHWMAICHALDRRMGGSIAV
jgi:hypothetical protein